MTVAFRCRLADYGFGKNIVNLKNENNSILYEYNICFNLWTYDRSAPLIDKRRLTPLSPLRVLRGAS